MNTLTATTGAERRVALANSLRPGPPGVGTDPKNGCWPDWTEDDELAPPHRRIKFLAWMDLAAALLQTGESRVMHAGRAESLGIGRCLWSLAHRCHCPPHSKLDLRHGTSLRLAHLAGRLVKADEKLLAAWRRDQISAAIPTA